MGHRRLTMSDDVLKDWQATTEILFGDVLHAADEVDRSSGACVRRSYVRSVFAAIDGSTYGMKRVALQVWTHRQPRLDADDLELLIETNFDQQGKGKKRFLPFGKSIKIAFDVFAKVVGSVSSVDYGVKGWTDLLGAADIRHRLMHPKSRADLEVSDSDLDTIRAGADWYFKTRNRLVVEATIELKTGI